MKTRIFLTALFIQGVFYCSGQVFTAEHHPAQFKHYHDLYLSDMQGPDHHHYFYGIYRNHSMRLLHDQDSAIIHTLIRRSLSENFPTHVYPGPRRLSSIANTQDSVLIHGYRSILERDNKAVYKLPDLNYKPEEKVRHHSNSNYPIVLPNKRTGLPYYLQENPYKRQYEIKKSERKE